MRQKNTEPFKYHPYTVSCVIAVVFVTLIAVLTCCIPNYKLDGLVVTFIAAIASIVVIGNFSQVSRIQDETDKKMNCLKDEMNDGIKKLNEKIEKVDSYSLKDDEKMKEDRDRREIYEHLETQKIDGVIIKEHFLNSNFTRFYFAIKNREKAIVITVSPRYFTNGGVNCLSEEEFVKIFPDKETQEAARNTLDDLKRFYGIK